MGSNPTASIIFLLVHAYKQHRMLVLPQRYVRVKGEWSDSMIEVVYRPRIDTRSSTSLVTSFYSMNASTQGILSTSPHMLDSWKDNRCRRERWFVSDTWRRGDTWVDRMVVVGSCGYRVVQMWARAMKSIPCAAIFINVYKTIRVCIVTLYLA